MSITWCKNESSGFWASFYAEVWGRWRDLMSARFCRFLVIFSNSHLVFITISMILRTNCRSLRHPQSCWCCLCHDFDDGAQFSVLSFVMCGGAIDGLTTNLRNWWCCWQFVVFRWSWHRLLDGSFCDFYCCSMWGQWHRLPSYIICWRSLLSCVHSADVAVSFHLSTVSFWLVLDDSFAIWNPWVINVSLGKPDIWVA